ncbi:alpha/beta-hydrolase [Coprinellus micaceus]|uniref:Alpha/beta-hydrolase n=1 Tax=Coprinellus micaceus TaxID=71717 RepID=A0A4Y7SZ03_COPMI|nr:alpha/beta-hydrolase [Coprinellus micaceus]
MLTRSTYSRVVTEAPTEPFGVIHLSLEPPSLVGAMLALKPCLHTLSKPRLASLQPPPDSDGKKGAVVILHGFFGSKRNWGSLTKAMVGQMKRPIYALDLRNHGTSPHAEPMNYTAMAEDVWHFIEQHGLSDVSVIGHSMGGKVAMAMALSAGYEKPSDVLSKLVVVDVSPIKGKISKQFRTYIDTLKEMEGQGIKSRKEANDYLARIEPDAGVRAFLLTNLLPFESHHLGPKFAVPLNIFKDYVPHIGDFPYLPGERSWAGKTLFVKGTKSAYIKDSYKPYIDQFFPNNQFAELETGHWVHAEKPQEFMQVVSKFITDA